MTMIPNPVVEDVTDMLKSHPEYSNHEKVFQVTDEDSGLMARIFIHSLIEGRALGGCRRWEYDDDAAWAADGLRLSRGMTRKSAVAGLPLGGAKAAINHGNPTPAMMRAFGKAIDMIEKQYGVTYITAEDVGISEDLLMEAKTQTPNVRGITPEDTGVWLAGGDPGPFTAYGVFAGMKAAAKHKLGSENLEGVSVAVQGLGDVGYFLCEFLHKEGAKLFIADLDQSRIDRVVESFGATVVSPSEIVGMDVDIFAPCAMGGVLDSSIQAKIVAGSTNNQQKDEINNIESKLLHDKGVLYAPDYVINSGGLISVFYEGEPADKIMAMIFDQVFGVLDRIFGMSMDKNMDCATIADELSTKMLSEKQYAPMPQRQAA